MHIGHVVIRNLRALEDVDFELSPRINVVVGPNAVGKTTILQALRLTKALLAPRINTEPQNVVLVGNLIWLAVDRESGDAVV
jgi:recombinational DNA repair ATPase RecF